MFQLWEYTHFHVSDTDSDSRRFKFEFIIAGSCSLFVLMCILIIGSVCVCAVRRYKKKTTYKEDDEYSLLPHSADYVEFDESENMSE